MDPRTAIDTLIKRLEGGFSNDLFDSGGMTQYGITQAEYDRYRLSKLAPTQSVANLSLSEADDIYINDYWNPVHASQLPDGLDFAVFQAGVNLGTSTASRLLQRVVGANEDGVIGSGTLSAVQDYINQNGLSKLIDDFLAAQLAQYDAIVAAKPSQIVFLQGWVNRVMNTKDIVASTAIAGGALAAGVIIFLLLKRKRLRTA